MTGFMQKHGSIEGERLASYDITSLLGYYGQFIYKLAALVKVFGDVAAYTLGRLWV